MNFRGDIGYSDLYVKVNGNTHMKIIIEVLSSKIDYKEAYEAILKGVNDILEGKYPTFTSVSNIL
ncbi:DUF2357 domain-containing protein [Clostridium sp. CM028]|uniref:DUF2357 domain-containing protein n=1 Tax=Clostridium sp. CM028 TaxID=2851575 RepID=UPI002715104E|nr:DUF2357 domain-containing protein [Clostridium sp. CM028]